MARVEIYYSDMLDQLSFELKKLNFSFIKLYLYTIFEMEKTNPSAKIEIDYKPIALQTHTRGSHFRHFSAEGYEE